VNIAQAIPLADTWGMHGDVGAGWMILMMSVMVLFWGAVIFGMVWLIRGAPTVASKESPVEILERRFAEGAITPEDYRARRDVLVDGPAHSNGTRKEELLTAP
jgi:uncharacterized membrane protein